MRGRYGSFTRNLDPTADYELREGADGRPYIAVWGERRLGPRPTEAQLADAWFRVVKKDKKAGFAGRMQRENKALYPEVATVDGAWVAEAFIDVVSEPRGARVASIKANKDRRARGYAAVDSKTNASPSARCRGQIKGAFRSGAKRTGGRPGRRMALRTMRSPFHPLPDQALKEESRPLRASPLGVPGSGPPSRCATHSSHRADS